MDCLTARSTLDLVPASSEGGPEAVQAAEHLAECLECQTVVRRRQAFDRQVGEVCRNVSVSTGLKGRLVAALEQAAPAEVRTAEVRAPEAQREARSVEPQAVDVPQSRGRRRLILALAGLAALVIVAIPVIQFLSPPPRPQISYVALVNDLTGPSPASEWAAGVPLKEFASGTLAAAPAAVPLAASQKTLARTREVEGDLGSRSKVVAGVWTFTVTSSRRKPMTVRLMVLPRSAVQLPHAVPPSMTGRWTVRYWTEADRLYLVAVEGPDHELRRVLPGGVI